VYHPAELDWFRYVATDKDNLQQLLGGGPVIFDEVENYVDKSGDSDAAIGVG